MKNSSRDGFINTISKNQDDNRPSSFHIQIIEDGYLIMIDGKVIFKKDVEELKTFVNESIQMPKSFKALIEAI